MIVGNNFKKVDITGVDLVELVKAVYDLSNPFGMGILHYEPGELTDEEAEKLVKPGQKIHMDYIKGRACKFYLWKEKGHLFVEYPWFDHTDAQFKELLKRIGMEDRMPKSSEEHTTACACSNCRTKGSGN